MKKFLASFTAVGLLVTSLVLAFPAVTGAETNEDIVRARLYRDGSISCSGADDTNKKGGQVVLFPAPNAVHFKVKLNKAQPNATYTLAVSEEPNCANAQFFPTFTTDVNGDAVVYGTYTTTAGTRNLLINMSTTNPDNPRNREIGTQQATVVVP